jgi:hypothetical protein
MDPRIEGLCPFLGFCDDRDTALSYPSKFNCCYKSKPVVPVSFSHQRTACLNKNYSNCPVYRSESIIPLPKEIAGNFPKTERSKPWLMLTIVIIVALIVVTLSALLGVFNLSGVPAFIKNASLTPTPSSVFLPSETSTLTPPTATFTLTLSPTGTATPVPIVIAPHFLETTFGENPGLVFHRVLEGESFILLANTYNTSADAIQAVNYGMENTLFADRVIVIPVNATDVSALPAFAVFEVTEDYLLIETVALGLNVDIVDLCKHNHLPQGYVLTKGEWLLIPR